MRVIVHTSNEHNSIEAIYAGIDTLAHPIIQAPMSEQYVKLMSVKRVPTVSTLTIGACAAGGACAGLAGAVEVAAVHGAANASLIAGYGYSGILIAFAARFSPAGVVPVAILVGGIAASGSLLQRRLGLPDASVTVLLGFAFVALIACETLRGRSFFRSRT